MDSEQQGGPNMVVMDQAQFDRLIRAVESIRSAANFFVVLATLAIISNILWVVTSS